MSSNDGSIVENTRSNDGSIVITTSKNIPALKKTIAATHHQLETGKLHDCELTWTIENLKSLHGARLTSEKFSPKDIKYEWCLKLYNGEGNSWHESYLEIGLTPSLPSYSIYRKFGGASGEIELAIIDTGGKKWCAETNPFNAQVFLNEKLPYQQREREYQVPEVRIKKFIELADLFSEGNASLLPGGALTIYCRVSFVLAKDIRTKVKTGFSRYFDNQELSDLKIKLQGKEYPAHKFVLAARSSVFKEMFERDPSSENQHLGNSVVIWGIDEDVFLEMLYFIYTGKVEKNKLKDANFASRLQIAADKYNIEDLKNICEQNQPKKTDDQISKFLDEGTQTLEPLPIVYTRPEYCNCSHAKRISTECEIVIGVTAFIIAIVAICVAAIVMFQ